jgi:hypothetical protein
MILISGTVGFAIIGPFVLLFEVVAYRERRQPNR